MIKRAWVCEFCREKVFAKWARCSYCGREVVSSRRPWPTSIDGLTEEDIRKHIRGG